MTTHSFSLKAVFIGVGYLCVLLGIWRAEVVLAELRGIVSVLALVWIVLLGTQLALATLAPSWLWLFFCIVPVAMHALAIAGIGPFELLPVLGAANGVFVLPAYHFYPDRLSRWCYLLTLINSWPFCCCLAHA